MMRTLRLSVALGLLCAAAACGTPNSGASSTPGSPISSTVLPWPATPPPTQPNQAYPDSTAISLRSIKWDQVEAGDGRQLLIRYTATGRSECNVLGRVDITETVDVVTVTVLVGQLPGANCGGAQPMLAAPSVTTVTLREPLGTRTARDGAS
jgi:hypothetical protein